MTLLYFVRHAEPTPWVKEDGERPLSAKGLIDRSLVTQYLQDRDVQRIYSSPYRRTLETIRPLSEVLGVPVQILDDLHERIVDEAQIGDMYAYSKEQWSDFAFSSYGGESLTQVKQRYLRALEQILSESQNKTVVIGTHGTALSVLLHEFQPVFGFDNFMRMAPKLPWIVQASFDGAACVSVAAYDVFTGEYEDILRTC